MGRKKRVFFETEEVIRKTRRGYIDLEMEYFQFYNAAFHHLASLTNNCAKDFVLWIMTRVNDDNEFTYSKVLYQDFLDDLSKIARPKKYSENTLHVAIRELVDDKIFIKHGRAQYMVNPKLFWTENTSKRIDIIRGMESNTRALSESTQGMPIHDEDILPEEDQPTTKDVEAEVVEEKVPDVFEEDDPLKY